MEPKISLAYSALSELNADPKDCSQRNIN